jgi:Predicted nucleoside-diphosphate sugar epimerases
MSSPDLRASDAPERGSLTGKAAAGDTRTLVVLAGIVSITIAAVYWILRTGFENPSGPVLKSVALSLFLITFPLAVRTLLVRSLSPERAESWGASYAFLWLAGIGFSGLIGRLVPVAGVNPFFLFGLFGIIAYGMTFVRWIAGQRIVRTILSIAGAIAFGVWTSGVVWGRIYKNPLFFESFITDGKVHHDTLDLAALGNMLRTYHVASSGIDGLNYVPYHWGSAWLFVQWANLIDIDVLRFYQLTFPVTIIPFFFGAMVALAIALANRRRREDDREARLNGFFWAVLIAIAVGIAPIAGLDAMGVWTSNILISESYTVAVPAALLFAAVVIAWADRASPDVRSLGSATVTPADWLFLIVVLPAGIVLLGYLKISLMALALAATVYLFVRLGLYRRVPFLVSVAVTTVAFYLTYVRVSLPAHREGLSPLDYLRDFVPLPWWPFFVLVHLAWTWVYAAYRVRQEGIENLGELWSAVRERRLIDVELIFALALTGIVPGLLIHIDGGSAFYFSDVQRWLAGAMLLSWIASAGTNCGLGPQRPRSAESLRFQQARS